MRLVATGRAESRAELARLSGLAASSVSLRVEQLIDAGLFAEEGAGGSRGRPAASASPGRRASSSSPTSARTTPGSPPPTSSAPLAVSDLACDIAVGPEKTLTAVVDSLRALAREHGPADVAVRGIGIGLPGPVDPATGQVVSPSRMPGWNDFPVRDFVTGHAGVPVLVENDANLMAVGEHRRSWPSLDNVMVIKLGSGIGCGIIVDGSCTAAAAPRRHQPRADPVRGDRRLLLRSPRLPGGPRQRRRARRVPRRAGHHGGQPVPDRGPRHRRRPAGDQRRPHPRRLIGDVLTGLVNFFNPDALVIGGSLSNAEPLVATIRGVIYERCLPLATRNLEIATSRAGRDASILGVSHLLLDISDEWIDRALVG